MLICINDCIYSLARFKCLIDNSAIDLEIGYVNFVTVAYTGMCNRRWIPRSPKMSIFYQVKR